jgi:hypothetical protein
VEYVDGEISRLLQEQALCELLPYKPAFISPIGVVLKKNGKFCLIINMRLLNLHIWPPRFKYNGLHELSCLLQPGDWLFTIDFCNGFQHMEVNRLHQHLLAIQWRGHHYTYKVLPFGLNASPWFFTHFVNAMTNALNVKGICCLAYMDDLIVMAPSQAQVLQDHNATVALLKDLGWSINWEKSSLTPSQSKEFLGLTVDTANELQFCVLMGKAHTLKHNIAHLLHSFHKNHQVPVRWATAVAGHCMSLTCMVLPAKLLLQNLYCDIATHRNWHSQICLSTTVINDLEEWSLGLSKWDSHVATT